MSLPAVPAMAGASDPAPYLRARLAAADGQDALAAHDYAAALAAAPDNVLIAIRAYRQGLESGDLALADRAAAVLARAGVAPADAPLQPLAEAARRGDPVAARAAIVALARGPLAPIGPALAALVAASQGGDPFAPLTGVGADPIGRRYAAETRALLLIDTGRTAEGIAAVRGLLGTTSSGPELRFDAAQALAAQGRRAEAASLLAGDDPALVQLRTTLGDGVRPSLGVDISRLFTRIGVALADDDPSPLVVALARAALRAEPGNDRARLLLADEMTRRGAYRRALALLDAVAPSGPFGATARTARVSVLEAAGDGTATLAAARALTLASDATAYDIQRYGDRLLAANRADDAAAQYARVVATVPASWEAWLQLGGALDRAGQWPQARAALERAVALAPDAPLALNYLGYARIEHGEAVVASEALLERAARLKPDDAAITDSLAWAYFRRGAVARALPMLERAAEGEPANEAIVEHLGDAYWAVGRRYEARYAWRAAAVLASVEDGARLSAKIARSPATR